MSTARRAILVMALGLLLALPVAARAEDSTVQIKEFVFTPVDQTLTAGGSVRWLNNDATIHDATALDETWDTPPLGIGEEASVTFETPGTYAYICSLHPLMRGTITVLPAPPDTSTAPSGTSDRQDWPSVLVLVAAGVLGAALALRRFRIASAGR